MPDLAEAGIQHGSQHRSWITGAQFKPCAEPGLLIIRCVVGELDAEMAAVRKADNEHRLVDARILDHPHRTAANDGLKAPNQFFAPVWAREDVCVIAESDHDVAGPSRRSGHRAADSSPAVASSHGASIRIR